VTAIDERDRLIRSFLEEGLTELPEWVYGAMRMEIDRLPQRRPVRDAASRAVMAAAVLVVLGFAGWNLAPRLTERATGPAASPPPATQLEPATFPPAGAITPGRHRVIMEGVTLTFDALPAAWVSDGTARLEHMTGSGGLTFWPSTPDGVYTDPCRPNQTPVETPSVAALAAAAASIPGTTLISGPSEVVVRGHPARLVVLTIPDERACPEGESGSYLWYDDAGGSHWLAGPGDTIRAWIIDVGGTPIWIDGETVAAAEPIVAQDLQQIIGSIRFE
jgi:hypothetical protein